MPTTAGTPKVSGKAATEKTSPASPRPANTNDGNEHDEMPVLPLDEFGSAELEALLQLRHKGAIEIILLPLGAAEVYTKQTTLSLDLGAWALVRFPPKSLGGNAKEGVLVRVPPREEN